MAEHRDDSDIFWVDPKRRGVIPLDGFHISRSLRRSMRNAPYRIAVNEDFEGTVRACANRAETWINAEIQTLYVMLHDRGHAHSLELWEDDTLVGGVYGVALGSAFFGESMFSRRRDTSKIALAYLVDRLRLAGFSLFDTQFITPHLESLGAIEISRAQYHVHLSDAMEHKADFLAPEVPSAQDVIQRNTQTS